MLLRSSQPATGLSALAPAQRAGAQRLCAMARCVDFGMSALTPLLGSKRTVLLLSAEHGQAGADPMMARNAVVAQLRPVAISALAPL